MGTTAHESPGRQRERTPRTSLHHDSFRAPTPKQSQVVCHSQGVFIALGVLPKVNGENGPGEMHTLCHLLAGTDMKSHPLESKQNLLSGPTIGQVVMC